MSTARSMRRFGGALLCGVVVIALVGGCGKGSGSDLLTAQPGGASPASTVEGTSAVIDITTTTWPSSDLCPPLAVPAPDSGRDFAADADAYRALVPDGGVIRAYTARETATFAEARVQWDEGQPPRNLVGFTADIERHRAALQSRVARPDLLIVCRMHRSQAQLDVIMRELQVALKTASSP